MDSGQSNDFCSQLQEASINITSWVQMMAQQMTEERAKEEKLLAENDMLKAEKTSLQKEKDSIVTKLQNVSTLVSVSLSRHVKVCVNVYVCLYMCV